MVYRIVPSTSQSHRVLAPPHETKRRRGRLALAVAMLLAGMTLGATSATLHHRMFGHPETVAGPR